MSQDFLRISKGLRPPAQAWRVCAYLGFTFGKGNNLNEVVADVMRTPKIGEAATALRLGMFVGR